LKRELLLDTIKKDVGIYTHYTTTQQSTQNNRHYQNHSNFKGFLNAIPPRNTAKHRGNITHNPKVGGSNPPPATSRGVVAVLDGQHPFAL